MVRFRVRVRLRVRFRGSARISVIVNSFRDSFPVLQRAQHYFRRPNHSVSFTVRIRIRIWFIVSVSVRVKLVRC